MGPRPFSINHSDSDSLSRCLISLCLFLSVSLRLSFSPLSLHLTSVDPLLCYTRGLFPHFFFLFCFTFSFESFHFQRQLERSLSVYVTRFARHVSPLYRLSHGQTALSAWHVSPLCRLRHGQTALHGTFRHSAPKVAECLYVWHFCDVIRSAQCVHVCVYPRNRCLQCL